MEKRQYELTFILPPALAEDEIAEVEKNVTTWIGNQEGEIEKSSHWGRRRLAYPIENYKEGYYILLEILMPPTGLTDVDRRMRLDASIIRHLAVRKLEV